MQIKRIYLKATLAAAPAGIAAVIVAAITASPGNAQVGFNAPLPADPRPNIPGPNVNLPNVNVPNFNPPNFNPPNINPPNINRGGGGRGRR
jgi:hypothetical protein